MNPRDQHNADIAPTIEKRRRDEFIEQYVINFMATVDANRVCPHSGVIVNPCKHDTALDAAQVAWERFKVHYGY